jgi:predicted CxxxxCH...CXXCH cytochrome family protein
MQCILSKQKRRVSMRKVRSQKPLLQLVMLALVSVVSVLALSGESYAALQCFNCHGDNATTAVPRDTPAGSLASYRNITTGAVKGSHQKHVGLVVTTASQAQAYCGRCHSGGAVSIGTYQSNHRSGTITMIKDINGSPVVTASYDGAGMQDGGSFVFKNQTSSPTLGTCSNVNCHFESVSPQWGANALVAPTDCGVCHQASPTTLAHTKHLAVGSHAPYTCNNCHAARADFQHATSAGNAGRNIDLKGTNMATATYTFSDWKIFPSQSAGRTGGQCSTVYCHSRAQSSNGNSATPAAYGTPLWNDLGNMTCDSCHQSGLSIQTGSHSKHIAAIAGGDCGQCHDGASFSSMNSTTHVDGNINVNGAQVVGYTGGTSKLPGTGYKTCTTALCHANPTAVANQTTVTWGTSMPNCTACHTGANAITALGPVNGSHTKHMSASGVACANCHDAATTATTMPSTNHANGTIDVVGVGYPAAKVKGSAYTTCNNASCHANPVGAGLVTTPTWGVVAASCTACHTGANAITTLGPVNGSHTKHMTASGVTCASCHDAATTATTMPAANHANGTIDVVGVGYPAAKAKGSAYTTCNNASCHANPVAAGLVTTPTWGVVAPNCTACHTGANAITALGPVNGSHTKHMSASGVTCVSCHNTNTTATTMPTLNHANGTIDVVGVGYPAAKAKGSAYTTCNNASCHANPVGAGLVTTPTWGVVATNCTACHTGANAITALGPVNGSHTKHMSASGVTCASCHDAATTATTMPAANHANGTIDVVGVGYPAAKAKGSAYTTCNNASCHANPVGAGLVTTPTWGVVATNCTACHTGANQITALGPVNGTHTKHMSRAGIACINCHLAGTTATTMPTTNHMNGTINVTVVGYPAHAPSGPAGYGSCSNVACHNPGALPAITVPAATWGQASSCTACHGYPPANAYHSGVAANTCNSCHTDVKSDNTFPNPALHLDGVVEGGKCNACHGYPPVKYADLAAIGHHNNYSTAKLQNYSGGGGVHSVAGHLALTVKASDGFSSACATCHYGINSNTTHNLYGNFSTHNVQVVIDPKFKFDKNRPIVYNGVRSGASKTAGTCTNVECHFQKSPIWSSETYTKRY